MKPAKKRLLNWLPSKFVACQPSEIVQDVKQVCIYIIGRVDTSIHFFRLCTSWDIHLWLEKKNIHLAV